MKLCALLSLGKGPAEERAVCCSEFAHVKAEGESAARDAVGVIALIKKRK